MRIKKYYFVKYNISKKEKFDFYIKFIIYHKKNFNILIELYIILFFLKYTIIIIKNNIILRI